MSCKVQCMTPLSADVKERHFMKSKLISRHQKVETDDHIA